MLVLTRRATESLMIDEKIELKVLRIKGNQVHIGIEAPRETAIHRKEVWLRLQDGESPERARSELGREKEGAQS